MARQTLEKDIEMLEKLVSKPKKQVAEEYKLTDKGLDSWLHRIRVRRKEGRWYENKILSIIKRNSRLKKILLSAQYEEDEDYF